MYLNSGLLFLAAAAGIKVAHADFMVYTEPPIPTSAIPSFANPSDAASWTTSVFLNANFAYNSFTRSLGDPYKSSQSSAASEIAAFVSTASNYSIPAAVTETTTTQTFYGAPTWYSALPSGARAFKEQQVSDQFSIVRQVIGSRQTTSSSSGAASVPTGRPFVRVEFGAMAAAAAAAFL